MKYLLLLMVAILLIGCSVQKQIPNQVDACIWGWDVVSVTGAHADTVVEAMVCADTTWWKLRRAHKVTAKVLPQRLKGIP